MHLFWLYSPAVSAKSSKIELHRGTSFDFAHNIWIYILFELHGTCTRTYRFIESYTQFAHTIFHFTGNKFFSLFDFKCAIPNATQIEDAHNKHRREACLQRFYFLTGLMPFRMERSILNGNGCLKYVYIIYTYKWLKCMVSDFFPSSVCSLCLCATIVLCV